MSKELSKFIQAHTIYFWDCPTKNLSSDAILERSINYADLPEIKQLIHILGYEKAKSVFKRLVTKKRINILTPSLVSYFYLFFGLQHEISYTDLIERTKRSAFF